MAAKWNHTSTSGSLLLLIFSANIGRQTFLLIGTSPVVMRSPYSLSTGSSRLAFKSSGPPLLLMAPSTPPPPKPPRLAALTIASLVSGQATVGCFLDGRMVLLLYRDLSLLTIIIASSSSSSSSCFFLFPLLVSSSFFFFLFLLCSSSCFFFVFLFLLLFSYFSFLFSFFFFFVFLLFSSSCFFCFFLLLFSSFLFFFLFLRLLILLILLNYSFYWSYSCSYHYSCVLLISSVLSTSPRCATSVLFTKSTKTFLAHSPHLVALSVHPFRSSKTHRWSPLRYLWIYKPVSTSRWSFLGRSPQPNKSKFSETILVASGWR